MVFARGPLMVLSIADEECARGERLFVLGALLRSGRRGSS